MAYLVLYLLVLEVGDFDYCAQAWQKKPWVSLCKRVNPRGTMVAVNIDSSN
jgi:hypothetical protein